MECLEDALARQEREEVEEIARQVAAQAQTVRADLQQQIKEQERTIQRLKSDSMPLVAVKVLVVMTALMTMTMIVANLCALKIWDFLSIPVDGGIILFPVTYIIGDLLCEIYGRKIADSVTVLVYIIGMGVILTIQAVAFLPDYCLADNSAYATLASNVNVVMAASLISFLAGQIVNNGVFERIRQKHGLMSDYQKRSITSSVTAHLVDALVFEVIAFYGRLPFRAFANQVFFAFIAGLWIELQLWPVNDWLSKKLIRELGYYNGKTSDLNPPPPSEQECSTGSIGLS